jgi:ribosomal protein S18 acetylase RimI-like enzyme
MALPDAITLRRAGVDDAPALALLHVDCWEDAYVGLIPQEILTERRNTVPTRTERWREALAEDPDVWLAVDTDRGLVGFAGTGEPRDNDMDVDLELTTLYVRARWWGTGVGYALLEAAIGDRAAYLWVLVNNQRAIRFYERQGFRLDGTEDEHDEGRHVRMVRAGTS